MINGNNGDYIYIVDIPVMLSRAIGLKNWLSTTIRLADQLIDQIMVACDQLIWYPLTNFAGSDQLISIFPSGPLPDQLL